MRVLLCAFCIFFQTLAADAAITPQELRDMAYAGDIDGAEQALRQAHQETLDGTLTVEELRELNNILIVSHPDVLDFVEDWMETYPDSPYAKTLRVFQTRNMAWTVRTKALAHRVSPEAMQTFRAMQEQGMDLALSAYEIAPDYVPASDAVLLHNQTTKRLSAYEHMEILTAVMEVAPNRGSLARASLLASHQWGGPGYRALIGLCDQFAEKVTDIENYTPEVCTIDLIHYYPSTDGGLAYSYELLAEHDHPFLARARAERALDIGTNEDMDDVIAYLSQPDVLDDDMVRNFDWYFSPTEKTEQFMALYKQQKREFVDNGILHDPYNANVLFRAFDFYTGMVPMPEPYSFVVEYDDEKGQFAYLLARRLVAASPYSGASWSRMGNAIPRQATDDERLRDEALNYDSIFVNSIYYGDHGVGYLVSFLQRKLSAYDSLRRLEEHDKPSPLTEDEEINHVLCPIIRLDRLHTARCEADNLDEDRCNRWSSKLQERVDSVITDIEERGLCRYEQNAALADLLYTEPMPFDLGELNEGIANR